MPWLIGIDEAGYGPNLGPLVMSATACRVPEEHKRKNLWKLLRTAVRRDADSDDDRFFVNDSKQVYSTARGLHDLEHAVLGVLSACSILDLPACAALDPFVRLVSLGPCEELCGECWYSGSITLPVEAAHDTIAPAARRFQEACRDLGIVWGGIRCVIVCPARFNLWVDKWGSKGAVLGLVLAELLRAFHNPDDSDEAVAFFIDKHGGRNTYSAILQHALEDGVVLAQEEGALKSVYQVIGLKRTVTITFQPRADGEHFGVALASMVSKYVRELLMLDFNRFWLDKVPGIKPTAGYPMDAHRFFEEIRPAVARLGILENSLWRCR